jgi:hypothetical protein
MFRMASFMMVLPVASFAFIRLMAARAQDQLREPEGLSPAVAESCSVPEMVVSLKRSRKDASRTVDAHSTAVRIVHPSDSHPQKKHAAPGKSTEK